MKIYSKAILIFTGFLFIVASVQSQSIPRPEYPCPQFERATWINLNGTWTYELDPVKTGLAKEFNQSRGFDKEINVPYPPESKLSGVGHTDFIPAIWYHRKVQIPADWNEKRINLNFGAIYYESEIYIDGIFVGRHFGGSDSFSLDITGKVNVGSTHNLVVYAKSDLNSGLQTAGKQSLQLNSWGCNYTRTTGIWQTVWMEAVDQAGIKDVVITTDIDQQQIAVKPTFYSLKAGYNLSVSLKDEGKVISSKTLPQGQGMTIILPVKKMKLWSPESPFLYDIEYTVNDNEGKIIDKVQSYAGMRKIHIEGNKIYLNNKPYYQRLVLDQGFYPDGIWTAPNDEALKQDILLSKRAGFNGARLHQKVFEERFHYWADKLGYITWGEAPSWGLDANNPIAARNFLTEWTNILIRDRNHPSIILWTPMNEQWWPDKVQYSRLCEDLYNMTHLLDPTRPINTASGGVHVKTDIWTIHNYEQDGQKLKNQLFDGTKFQQSPNNLIKDNYGNIGFNYPESDVQYNFPLYTGGMPYLIDEFGGIRYIEGKSEGDNAWGYGNAVRTRGEFYERVEGQVDAILSLSDYIWGYCYTQLTDVEQEQNGIYNYDRSEKFDMDIIRRIFCKEPKK